MAYYVYILSSRSRNLYTGVTNNIGRRVWEHREGEIPGFTERYRIHRLVYLEPYADVRAAIAREKQIKRWRREKKVSLIEVAILPGVTWQQFGLWLRKEKSRSLGYARNDIGPVWRAPRRVRSHGTDLPWI